MNIRRTHRMPTGIRVLPAITIFVIAVGVFAPSIISYMTAAPDGQYNVGDDSMSALSLVREGDGPRECVLRNGRVVFEQNSATWEPDEAPAEDTHRCARGEQLQMNSDGALAVSADPQTLNSVG